MEVEGTTLPLLYTFQYSSGELVICGLVCLPSLLFVFLALYIEYILSVFDCNNCCIVVAVLVWQLQQTHGFLKYDCLK